MLQKDGEDVKDIRGVFKKDLSFINKRTKTVTFKLVNSIYNGKNKTPRSINIETAYISEDSDTGFSHEYRYYESKNARKTEGFVQDIYKPEYVPFGERGDVTISVGEKGTDNLDKIAWYLNHPRRAKSRNGDGTKRPLFYLHDENKEAQDEVRIIKERSRMHSYIYVEETRLSDDKLRTIARSLRVHGVEDMTIELVQRSIDKKCSKNPSLFLNKIEVTEDVLVRANIQKGVEEGHLSYSSIKTKWTLIDSDSGRTSELAPVRKTEDETNALVYWFKNTDTADSYGKLVELLTGKPSQTKKVDESKNSDLEIELELLKEKNKKLQLEKEISDNATVKAQAELEKSKLSVLPENKPDNKNKKKAVS